MKKRSKTLSDPGKGRKQGPIPTDEPKPMDIEDRTEIDGDMGFVIGMDGYTPTSNKGGGKTQGQVASSVQHPSPMPVINLPAQAPPTTLPDRGPKHPRRPL